MRSPALTPQQPCSVWQSLLEEVSDLYQRPLGSEGGLVLSTEPVVALCCQCSSDNRSRADCTTASKGSTDFL